MAVRRLSVPREASGQRLDKFLASALPAMTLERARALADQGHVRIRGKVAKSIRKLWGGEEVEVDAPGPRALPKVDGPRLPILYEDARWLIVDKPPGLTVEPEGNAPSVVTLLASQAGGFDVEGVAAPGVAHRLDRETSGCLALARTDEGLAALKDAFLGKRVQKEYLALVLGTPPAEQRLEAPYARDPKDPRRYTTRVPSARRAALSFRVVEQFRDGALVSVHLETGRTHQIRVQLSEAGFPLLGDPLYGTEASRTHAAARALGRLALHAVRLRIDDVAVTAPVPADFQRAQAVLAGRE